MALISKEELEEMYRGEPGTEMGVPTISKKIGCSKSTIYYYMKKYNIETRPSTREQTGECLTKISRKIISKSAIENWFDREPTEKAIKNIAKARRDNAKVNKEKGIQIFREYHNKKITQKELAKKYNLNLSTINCVVSGEHFSTKHLKYKHKSFKKGQNHPQSRIKKEQGLKIYYQYKHTRKTQYELANEYNLSQSTVMDIVKGKHGITCHLPPVEKNYNYAKNNNPRSIISKKLGRKIFIEYHNSNKTQKELAKKYNLSSTIIGNITRKEHWTTKHLNK